LLRVITDLGADPVDMPMGEVYSALAKGVLDGVVAPADTLRSLHFAEVAHYFNTIRIPRGAYASRAMGETRWNQLTSAQHALLERSISIWEDALATEISAAERAGERTGHERGVQFFEMPATDQRRFDVIYERDAERRAHELTRYGIDAIASFRRARAIANGLRGGGNVQCEKGNDRETA
jgi:TRAP-type C4-dicarboxylate transport system substrate-binding protein